MFRLLIYFGKSLSSIFFRDIVIFFVRYGLLRVVLLFI